MEDEIAALTMTPRLGIPPWAWTHIITTIAASGRRGGRFLWHSWDASLMCLRMVRAAIRAAQGVVFGSEGATRQQIAGLRRKNDMRGDGLPQLMSTDLPADTGTHRNLDLVLEGGGVKGIGLVGAVLTLSDAGYRFPRVAGTSAGRDLGGADRRPATCRKTARPAP